VSEPSPPTSPRAAPALAPARLKRRGEFLRVAARGRRVARPGLVLQAMPAAASAGSGAPPRLGFTVTRKVGGAVVRNRGRRRLKEVARLTFREHPEAARGWDLVLIGREGTARRGFQDLRADLEGALRQLGAWSGAPPRPAAAGASERAARRTGEAAGRAADGPAACRRPAAGPAAAPSDHPASPPPAGSARLRRGAARAAPAAPEAPAP
jgi:ribonuclease P protein component